MNTNLPTAAQCARAARDALARVSEWADSMPGATDAERLANIRRIVRAHELAIEMITAPAEQPGPAVQSRNHRRHLRPERPCMDRRHARRTPSADPRPGGG